MSAYNELQLSSFVDQIFERLRALEAQMVRVSEASHVSYEAPWSGVPQEVIDLVEAGDRLGAMKKYREATGVSLADAQAKVAEL